MTKSRVSRGFSKASIETSLGLLGLVVLLVDEALVEGRLGVAEGLDVVQSIPTALASLTY